MTEREAFESWFSQEFRCDEWEYNPFSRMEFNGIDAYSCSTVNTTWSAWQAAKAQAVPEGFVVVPKEPYAYLIKHKFWQKGSDPEIFLAEEFLGDAGVEKDKLTVCIPLYLGDDEAQEPIND